MRRSPWLIAVLLAAGVFSPLALFSAAPPADYASQLAAAQALARENSHALAAQAFATAARIALSSADRHWCELWQIEQQIAAHDPTFPAGDAAARLTALGAPYTRGLPRDRFWAATTLALAGIDWPHRLERDLEVVRWYATQPSTPGSDTGFAEALRQLIPVLEQFSSERSGARAEALDLVRRAAEHFPERTARAEFALAYAQLIARSPGPRIASADRSDVAQAWDDAVATAQSTPLAAEAGAGRAAWWANSAPFAWQAWSEHHVYPVSHYDESIPGGAYDWLLTQLATADQALGTANAPRAAELHEQLKAAQDRLSRPTLRIGHADTLLPSAPQQLTLIAQHVANAVVTVYRLDARALRLLDRHERRDQISDAELGPVVSRDTVPTGLTTPRGLRRIQRPLQPTLAPGLYAIVVTDPANGAQRALAAPVAITTAQALVTSLPGHRIGIWAYDQTTGALLTRLHAAAWDERAGAAVEGNGSDHVELPWTPSRQYGGPISIAGEANGQPFYLANAWLGGERDATSWTAHLMSDRPLYQPGETAHWRLVLRRLRDGRVEIPSGEITIAAELAGTQLVNRTFTLDRFGTVHDAIPLPADARSGAVNFEISRKGDGEFTSPIRAFTVDRFRPPEIVARIEPATPDAIRNADTGTVPFTVNAQYYSGEPVAGATVELVANFQPYATWFERMDGDASAGRASEQRLAATLDALGRATVRVAIPSEAKRQQVKLTATVQTNGATAHASYEFDQLPGGYDAEITPADTRTAPPRQRYGGHARALFAGPGAAVSLKLFARDGSDAGVRITGTLVVERQTWEEVWRTPTGELLTGDALHRREAQSDWPPHGPQALGWQQLYDGYRRENIVNRDLTTDPAGVATFEIPPLSPGYYRVLFQRGPTADSAPAAERELFVADRTTDSIPYHAEGTQLIPATALQEPGTPVRLLLLAPRVGLRGLLLVNGTASWRSEPLALRGNVQVLELPWQDDWLAGLHVAAELFRAGSGYSADDSLAISRAAHEATVTIVPSNSTAAPGSDATLRVRLSDRNGQPVTGALAVSVADEAVADLVPEDRTDLRADLLSFAPPPSWRMTRSSAADIAPALPDSAGVDTLGVEVVTLSQFSVSAHDRGYFATSSLAGSRPKRPDPAATVLGPQGGGNANMPDDVRVRSSFSSTAFWSPELLTDARGEANVTFRYPDNLTKWRIDAEAVGDGNRFGSATASTQTTLPVQARLRVPSSLVVGDSVALVGAVVRQQPTPGQIAGELTTTSPAVIAVGPAARQDALAGTGEVALAWRATAKAAGAAELKFTASDGQASDGMTARIPVQEDGFLQQTGLSRRVTGNPATFSFDLPEPFHPDRTNVGVDVSPGIVPSLMAALPYLVDYPYGCVEQTTSRFVPAVAVASVLRAANVSAAEIDAALAASRLVQPPGRHAAAGLQHLDEVVAQSLQRLEDAQLPDGSFGWFSEGQRDPYMTGYVLRGLNAAKRAGIAVPPPLLEGTNEAVKRFLANTPRTEANASILAWLLAAAVDTADQSDPAANPNFVAVYQAVFAVRDRLSPSRLALLTHAAVALHCRADLPVLRRNLENGVRRSQSAELGDTAQWGKTEDYFDGLDGAVESTALVLQSLLELDPHDPLAAAAANFLLVNRHSNAWDNTRATAHAVLALLDFARAQQELRPAGGFVLRVNDTVAGQGAFTRDALVRPIHLAVPAASLHGGRNTLTVEPTGGATAGVVLTASSWSDAATAKPQGSFLTLDRSYTRLIDRPTAIGTTVAEPQPLTATTSVIQRGDRLECRVVVNVSHDLDYVLVEAPKPGGAEPLNPLSGWDATLTRLDAPVATGAVLPLFAPPSAGGRPIFREEHADHSAFFLPNMPAGRWEIRYVLRGSLAGDFRILPTTISAMYVPFLAANTAAQRLEITSR